MTDLGERVERLEDLVARQQDTIASHEETIDTQVETIERQQRRLAALGDRPGSAVGRRQVLQAGGLLGLLGLGVASTSASPSGQVGTADRPVETLHTAAIDGPIVDGEAAITDFSSGPDAGSVPIREAGGELAVTEATDDDHAVVRGQDIDWPGQHDFAEMPRFNGSPVVESDSNSDGYWTRWADGTQVCWSNDVEELNVSSNAENVGWSLPASFESDQYYTDLLLNYDTMANHDNRSSVVARPGSQSASSAVCTVVQSEGDNFSDEAWTELLGWALGRWSSHG